MQLKMCWSCYTMQPSCSEADVNRRISHLNVETEYEKLLAQFHTHTTSDGAAPALSVPQKTTLLELISLLPRDEQV